MALDLGVFLEGAGSSFKVKVTKNDAVAQYLKDKLFSSDASVTITETNDGSTEKLDITTAGSPDTNIANTDLTQDGDRTVTQDGYDLHFDEGIAVGTTTLDSSAYLEIGGSQKGLLIPRMTTSNMNGILTPADDLIIYNTDLNALYRYDGANWVALSAGYGVIEVITDADGGTPTYYADLQSALETCKTSGSNNTVTLYSDVTLSSELSIKNGGSGVGNAYDYNSLTINLNGFKIVYDDASTDNAITVTIGNSSSNNCTFILVNGQIERTSGTSTHEALQINGDGNVTMDRMVIYCENSQAVDITNSYSQTSNGSINDFGNSVFVSNASSGDACGFIQGRNFKVISLGNAGGFNPGAAGAYNAYVKCYGSGDGVGGSGNLYYSYVETNSGNCIDGNANYYHCELFSTTGYIARASGAELYHCFGETGNSNALRLVSVVDNCTIINNSSSDLIQFPGTNRKSTFINKGSGKVADVNFDTRIFDDCELISVGGVPVTSSGTCNGKLRRCFIQSQWDNASGHAVSLGHSSNTLFLSNCVLEVTNASANCLYSGSARNVSIGNSALNGATTPINANVTVSLTSAPDSNGNYTN